jgi:hypothetical protein
MDAQETPLFEASATNQKRGDMLFDYWTRFSDCFTVDEFWWTPDDLWDRWYEDGEEIDDDCMEEPHRLALHILGRIDASSSGYHTSFKLTSAEFYAKVLNALGGTAKFAAWQICLDIGYRFPELYNEDEHVVVGRGCLFTEEKIDELKPRVQGRVKMKVTKQTIEGLEAAYQSVLLSSSFSMLPGFAAAALALPIVSLIALSQHSLPRALRQYFELAASPTGP